MSPAAALVALTLAASPCGDLPWTALEAKYATAESRYLDLPGGLHVHYRDQGPASAPPLVMAHGFSASLDAWEPWVARLKGAYRIVTLDLPGHGLTRAPSGYHASIDGYADITDEVASRLKIERYVVVGNSMGGAVAWDDALRHPDHVRGLVLVDAAGWPSGRRHEGSPLVFKLLTNPLGRAVIRTIDVRPMARDGLKKAYVDKALVTPALVDRYVDFSRAPGHRDILMTIKTTPGAGVTPETFKAIRVPTLVMHGKLDPDPGGGRSRLRRRYPGRENDPLRGRRSRAHGTDPRSVGGGFAGLAEGVEVGWRISPCAWRPSVDEGGSYIFRRRSHV